MINYLTILQLGEVKNIIWSNRTELDTFIFAFTINVWERLRATVMWYWISAWILAVLTVIGNGLVVYLVVRMRRLHTTANWFVLSLAVADFFVGLCYFPLLFAYNVNNLDSPPESNNNFFLVSRTFLYVSITNLCVMIMDRYVAIVHPLKYLSLMTTKVTIFEIAASWIAPILLFTIPFALKVPSKSLLLFRVFALQFAPVLLFVYVTTRIFLITRKISKRKSKIFAQLRFNHQSVASTMDSCSETTASAKMTVAIILFFTVCYIVENYKCFCAVFGLCQFTSALGQTADFLFVINSAANPIAYAFLKRDIRTAIRRLFKIKSRGVVPGHFRKAALASFAIKDHKTN